MLSFVLRAARVTLQVQLDQTHSNTDGAAGGNYHSCGSHFTTCLRVQNTMVTEGELFPIFVRFQYFCLY